MVFSCSARANIRCRAPDSSWGSLSLPWRWEAGRGALLCGLPLEVPPSTGTSSRLWIRSLLIGWRRCWWAKQGVAHSREVWRQSLWHGRADGCLSLGLLTTLTTGLQSQVGKEPAGNCCLPLSYANRMHYAMLGPIFPAEVHALFFGEACSPDIMEPVHSVCPTDLCSVLLSSAGEFEQVCAWEAESFSFSSCFSSSVSSPSSFLLQI